MQMLDAAHCSLMFSSGQVRGVSSGDPDDELMSVVAIKGGKKVICGSQTGILNIFSWGKFEEYSDRFPGMILVVAVCTGAHF